MTRMLATAGSTIHPNVTQHFKKLIGPEFPAVVQPKKAGSHGIYFCIDCDVGQLTSCAAAIHNKDHRIGWYNGKTIEAA